MNPNAPNQHRRRSHALKLSPEQPRLCPPRHTPAKRRKRILPCGPLRTFSFGGGWQSVAALALAARGELDFRTFLFANVGDDSEHPATLDYVRRYAIPYAEAHDIRLRELHRVRLPRAQDFVIDHLEV